MYKFSQQITRPKIGLALGSGSARGFAHIGVIQTLLENHIPIDYIAGSSIGALIGSFFAVQGRPDFFHQGLQKINRKKFLDFCMPKMGLIKGNKIQEMVSLFTYGKHLEQFHIPMAVVATELQTGKRKVFVKGNAAEAVRASISIPGVFVPYEIQGKRYIDGGVIDRVPVTVVRQMGAHIVIGVDVSSRKIYGEVTSIFDVIMQSLQIMETQIIKPTEFRTDILIRPDVERFKPRAFTNLDQIIMEGARATKAMLPKIREVIAEFGK